VLRKNFVELQNNKLGFQKVKTDYGVAVTGAQIGTVVTIEDQANKQRRSITNALGQLTRVDEPNDSGQLGAIDNPTQPTNYSYDTLSNLTTVSQGVQTRTFAYDSLARLKQATNPESGIINYNYDDNGNLTGKIDARNITTSYVYDALNRVKTRTYTGETGYTTPNVTYTYDNLPNAKGKLTKVVTGDVNAPLAETRYTAFDNLGRVTGSQQITEGTAYNPQSYVYNLSGALIEETYPSGRVVKNTLDNDGDLSQVQSRKANDSFRNYANSFNYTAAGAVSSMRLGNGRWENTTFNSRLQPTQIGLGASAASQNSLKLNFDYGTTDNNGNVKSQQITVPTIGAINGFTAIQTYTYDSLNRIKDAKEMIGTSQQWKQTFLYDRYGNRRFDTANNNTATLQANCVTAVCNPQIDPATNKLIGYTFDSAGNTKVDANNRQYIYDAENKQVEVKDANNASIGKYFYDGDGKRVKKISNTETTVFVYNANGQLVAEYSTNIAQPTEAKVSYLTNDHLGSPRITTDANGQVISRRDFQPFGEEIARANYGNDLVRQKFTGYEKDKETDLDFAQARMYGNSYGRFTSPDDFFNDTELNDPQSLNKYIYVRNNPLNLIDPTGKKADVNVTYDEKTKTYNITVNAKFGVYVESGKLSQKEINKQMKLLKTQIENTYKESFKNGDFKFNVSASVTVKQYSSESAAVEDAKKSKIDNVVGLVKGSFIGGGEPGNRENPDAIGRGYRVEGENFDRMLVATNSTKASNTYAHEFGHLLNARGHQNQSAGLMNSSPSGNNNLGANDFNHIFTKHLDSNNSSSLYVNGENNRQRLWYGTVRAATVYKQKSTTSPR
jgi:RHS repeat-associated protein